MMAGDSLDSRTIRLGMSLFHAVLLIIGAVARLIKGVALYVTGWTDELSKGCLAIVAVGANRKGRISGELRMRSACLLLDDIREETVNEGTIRTSQRGMTSRRIGLSRRLRSTSLEMRVRGIWVMTEEGFVVPHTFPHSRCINFSYRNSHSMSLPHNDLHLPLPNGRFFPYRSSSFHNP